MVKAISGVMTVRFKNELVRNITIKLGYANAKVRSQYHISHIGRSSNLYHRSTNVKMKHAHGLDATDLTARTKKTTHPVRGLDVVIK